MRKFLVLVLALPLFALAQEKTVINTTRVFPKADKVSQFEKALALHAQKYHTGNFKWRVYTVESGPDAGAYHIVEGPNSWDDIDKRGDLGKEHQADWNNNVAPLLTDKETVSYSVYRPDLSTVQLTEYSDKIAITHIYPKPGYTLDMEDMIQKLKKTWESSSQSVAVYEMSSSGEPQFALVNRYKKGLQERERGYFKPFRERYDAANGDGSYATFQQALRTSADRTWSELLFYHPELSSK